MSTELSPPLQWNLPLQLLDSSEPRVFSNTEPATTTTAMGLSPEEGPVWSCGQLLQVSCLSLPYGLVHCHQEGDCLNEAGGIGSLKYGLPASLHCKRTPAASSWPPVFLPPGFHTISQSPSLGPLSHPLLLYLQTSLGGFPWLSPGQGDSPGHSIYLAMKPGYSHVSKGNFSQQQ